MPSLNDALISPTPDGEAPRKRPWRGEFRPPYGKWRTRAQAEPLVESGAVASLRPALDCPDRGGPDRMSRGDARESGRGLACDRRQPRATTRLAIHTTAAPDDRRPRLLALPSLYADSAITSLPTPLIPAPSKTKRILSRAA